MRRTKTLLIIAGLALLLACFAVLGWRRNKPAADAIADNAQDGTFLAQVEKPLLARAPWELPRAILGARDTDLRFDHTTSGAQIGSVTANRLELSAGGGWDLLIESDGEGRVAPGTRLIFPIILGGRDLKFNCRPANRASGRFNTAPRAGSDKLDGNFFFELTDCKNAVSGKNAAGLPWQ